MELYDLLGKPDYLFDSHAHFYGLSFEELSGVVENAIAQGVHTIFDIGIDVKSSIKAVETSKEFKPKVYAFAGIDPEVFIPGSSMLIDFSTINDSWFEKSFEELKNLVLENKDCVKGIGESGMDFYWMNKDTSIESAIKGRSKKLQEQLFRLQLELGTELQLPLSIHSRGAEKECLAIVKEYDIKGIFHSYTGDYDTAKEILESGWGLGVNGIITFKNAGELRDVYKKILSTVSADWTIEDFYKKGIYFETDSPFLAPEGKRGQKNEPANVAIVFDKFLEMLLMGDR